MSLQRSMDPTDRVRLARLDRLGGVELVSVDFVRRATPPHSHFGIEIGIIAAGLRRVHCGGRTFPAPPGSVLVFAPGEVHAGAPEDPFGASYRSFVLSPAFLEAECGWTGDRWFASPIVGDPALASQLLQAHAALQTPSADGASHLRAVLRRLGASHRVAPPRRPPPSETVRIAQAYLARHFARRVRLSFLAELTGISVYHFVRRFHAETGLPPYAYLLQLRVNEAALLLRAGIPVSQVAYRVGFADQSHLTRLFNRLVGVPPGQYQRVAGASTSGDVGSAPPRGGEARRNDRRAGARRRALFRR